MSLLQGAACSLFRQGLRPQYNCLPLTLPLLLLPLSTAATRTMTCS